jgi:tRNA U34 5-carboxymethylaminomethyl modifying GTPase MnmE/TrmE
MMRVANATKRSDAILLVYDLSRPETFQRLRRWLDLIARYKEIPVVLVANKVDIALPSASDSQIRQLMGMYRVSDIVSHVFMSLCVCVCLIYSKNFIEFSLWSIILPFLPKNFQVSHKRFIMLKKLSCIQ